MSAYAASADATMAPTTATCISTERSAWSRARPAANPAARTTRAQRPTVPSAGGTRSRSRPPQNPISAPAMAPPLQRQADDHQQHDVRGRARKRDPLSTAVCTMAAVSRRVAVSRTRRYWHRSAGGCRGRRQDRVPRVAARRLDHDTDQVEGGEVHERFDRRDPDQRARGGAHCPHGPDWHARHERGAPPIRRSRSGRPQPTGLRSSIAAPSFVAAAGRNAQLEGRLEPGADG